MLKLRIIQADYGDSLILEYGTDAAPRYLLVDGGPSDVYADHLREELDRIGQSGGRLDVVAVSHVDTDHITGVLDLFAEIRDQRANGSDDLVRIDNLWHNAFDQTIDTDDDIGARFARAMANGGPQVMRHGSLAINGIGEGNQLRIQSTQLDVPINAAFPTGLICTDDAPPSLDFGNLTLRIVGPSRANLDALKEEWREWLDRYEADIASGDLQLMANADRSIPNLSSLMFLAEADGKTVLFTGDARSDHLLEGLAEGGHLDVDGKVHVDVLKVMHHGSNRNATRTFFRKVTADAYVISANGHPDNPDLSTLIWIVEGAHEQGRRIKLHFTNETFAVRKLREEYPAADYGYEMDIMPDHYRYRRIELAP